MEKFHTQETSPSPESVQEQHKEIYERVSKNSLEFDRKIAAGPLYAAEEIRKEWRTDHWRIGDTQIEAIGVAHVPETFLQYRDEIEKAIQESDIVVNEFAPEALGFYDAEQGKTLAKMRSRFNPDYSVEDLRQAFIKNERHWGIGAFHHEVELLTAKYGKDMASFDLIHTKDPEDLMQDMSVYTRGAEEVAERKMLLPRIGLYTSAAAAALMGLERLIESVKKSLNRRDFLKSMGFLSAGAILGTVGKEGTKVSRTDPIQIPSEDMQLETLRDPYLAESLRKLAVLGYRKITFIYGSQHIDAVKQYLDNPGDTRRELDENKDLIYQKNKDPFRIWKLGVGKNNSERFKASPNMRWERIKTSVTETPH